MAPCLENEDLGRAFYEKLTNRSGIKLIDFEDFSRNSSHVVNELPCKKDVEKENSLLENTNYQSIKNAAEFITNKNPDSPTHRICTSLFQPECLSFLLHKGRK